MRVSPLHVQRYGRASRPMPPMVNATTAERAAFEARWSLGYRRDEVRPGPRYFVGRTTEGVPVATVDLDRIEDLTSTHDDPDSAVAAKRALAS